MKRRSFIQGVSATAAFALAAPHVARAQAQEFEGITLNVRSYGGESDRIRTESIAAPLFERTGLQVVYQGGGTTAGVAQLLASPRDNPPFDVILCDSPNMPDLIDGDLIDPITADDVPNVAKILPGRREFGDFGVPVLTNAVVLTYNTERLPAGISSYQDLNREDLRGRVGLMSPENNAGVLGLIALAEAYGGGLDNMQPAYDALQAMRENVAAVAPETVNLLQLFEQEEAWAGSFFDGRIYSMRAAGHPMATVIPEEGIHALFGYVSPVKGTRHPEAVRAYIEQSLSDEAVAPLVDFFRYAPCTDIALPEDVAADIIINTETEHLLKAPDWRTVSAERGALIENFGRALR